MRAYGKNWNYNVYSCKYCLYWHGKRQGCTYPDGCCCNIPQHPARRNGEDVIYTSESPAPVEHSECEGCPYGRYSPCIGWCTKELLKHIRHGDDT